ncbi:MAG: hypothetical protein M9965_02620 [Anaerolineae bacterium]|nr:hypothetical protein [Anaerolineae bacterium]
MESINQQVQKRPLLWLLISALVGFFVGLVIFGWGLTPPTFVDGGPQHLSERDLKIYLGALADAYAVDGNADRVRYALCWWDEDPDTATQEVTAQLQALVQSDPQNADSYMTILAILAQEDCTAFRARVAGQDAVPGTETGSTGGLFSSNLLRIVGFAVLLLLLLGALYYFLSRRQRQQEAWPTDTAGPTGSTQPPGAVSQSVSSEPEPELLASFRPAYRRGDDMFDKSYIIENDNGDFLGECGISISEASNAGDTRNVTAFEIWLFDKNDTQTVTKVLMSDGAYNDDGIRAKLATRGELIMAELGRTIPLETASLIINAEIAELLYNEDAMPLNGVFDRLTIDLSAWVKGDMPQAADGSSEADSADLLDF